MRKTLRTLTIRVLHETHPRLMGLESLEEPLPSWLEYEPRRHSLEWNHVETVCKRWKIPPVQNLGHGPGYRRGLLALRLLAALPSVHLRMVAGW
jgi:hypothetical protein